MSISWNEVLDDLEARLNAAEAALDSDQALPVDPFVPPSDIAPLPESLRDRALSVLRRQTELEARVETLKAAISRDIRTAAQQTRAPSPFAEASAPRYYDSHA